MFNQSSTKDESGFTLIELLVVILIIGVLSAIAVPAFLNQRKSAAEASVKSDLKSAATAFETEIISNKTYPTEVPTTVKTSEGVMIEVGSGNADTAVTGNIKKTSDPNGADVKWEIDSRGWLLSTRYSTSPTTSAIWFYMDTTCDGIPKPSHTGSNMIITQSSDPVLLEKMDPVPYMPTCPSGTEKMSVTISPQHNSNFEPFTVSNFASAVSNDGYCIQGYHESDVSNIWKYDSANGGLSEGSC